MYWRDCGICCVYFVVGWNEYPAWNSVDCSMCINKIAFVQLLGEDGSAIDQRGRIDPLLPKETKDDRLTVTLYEGDTYRLHVQLQCGRESKTHPSKSPCSDSLSVNAHIDLNDNGIDDGESELLLPSWSNNKEPTGAYHLDLHIPNLDQTNVNYGLHRMYLSVMPTVQYQRKCGALNYREMRDYTVKILPRAQRSGKRRLSSPLDGRLCPLIVRTIFSSICSTSFRIAGVFSSSMNLFSFILVLVFSSHWTLVTTKQRNKSFSSFFWLIILENLCFDWGKIICVLVDFAFDSNRTNERLSFSSVRREQLKSIEPICNQSMKRTSDTCPSCLIHRSLARMTSPFSCFEWNSLLNSSLWWWKFRLVKDRDYQKAKFVHEISSIETNKVNYSKTIFSFIQ